MLTGQKKTFYNKAPLVYLMTLSELGYEYTLHNGFIEDIDRPEVEIFNHAHADTFVNAPVGIARVFK